MKKEVKEKSVTILTSVSGSQDISFSDHAVLCLTKKYLTWLFAMRAKAAAIQKQNMSFYSLIFFDNSCEWIDNNVGDLDWLDNLCDIGDWVFLKKETPPYEPMRSECDQLVITCDAFYWKAYAKHSDVRHETQVFRFED